MIHPIVRMYDSTDKANAAAAKVKDWGIAADMVSVISTAATGTGDGLKSALMAANIVRDNATAYAHSATAGSTFVVVRAPFGSGRVTQDMLDSCKPTRIADPTEDSDSATWDDAAPLSSALGIPAVSEWRPFGGLPTGVGPTRTLSESLGLPLLNSGAPMFGGLTDSRPWTEKFGLPLLLG